MSMRVLGANWRPGNHVTQPGIPAPGPSACRTACRGKIWGREEAELQGVGTRPLLGGWAFGYAVARGGSQCAGPPSLSHCGFLPLRTPRGTTECTVWPSASSPLPSSPSCPFFSKVRAPAPATLLPSRRSLPQSVHLTPWMIPLCQHPGATKVNEELTR